MKIILVGLASVFTEGMTYQDNLLANQLKKDGHDVIVIAECYKYDNGKVVHTAEIDMILDNGIRLIRMEYRIFVNEFISGKVRAVRGLYNFLESEKPDIIFHHGLQTYELLTVAKYKKNHPTVKLFADSHEDFHNSATNILSKQVLHKMYYKFIIRKSLKFIDKIFCVGYECFDFVKTMYGIPDDMLEFYPLGGIVLEENVREAKRKRVREELELNEDDLLIVHSGKMDKLKRTEQLLEAFEAVKSANLKLILIGSLPDEVKGDVLKYVLNDERVTYLGWKTGDQLFEYLCASDLYLQPGTQSATMQNALCCGSAAALYPYPSHKYLLGEAVFYIESVEDMKCLFDKISKTPELLESKRMQSNTIAREVLDYRVLAARLY